MKLMDELLYKKIEALRDMVKGLTSKPGQASLVPALKLPQPKPLSMPSVSNSAPAQLPGVAVPSNKDPKAIAAQLKNPRPKKPKMEMLKFDSGGQWKIEKSTNTDDNDAISLLNEAIALHKKHIDMPTSATSKSQNDMMDLMKEALKLLKTIQKDDSGTMMPDGDC